jgi:hypothetical protein
MRWRWTGVVFAAIASVGMLGGSERAEAVAGHCPGGPEVCRVFYHCTVVDNEWRCENDPFGTAYQPDSWPVEGSEPECQVLYDEPPPGAPAPPDPCASMGDPNNL